MTPYYQSPVATLYLGDALEVLPSLAPVDHTITDPPFEAEAHTQGRRGKTFGGVVEVRALDFPPITPEQRREAGQWIARLTQGWALVFCQVEAVSLWRATLEPPARYLRTQIWVKPGATPQFTGDRPAMGYESIVTTWSGLTRPRWNGGGATGVYTYHYGDHGTGHLTEKPLPLMRELVRRFTDPGQTVLDPFAGSGSTLVAAVEMGRRGIGIEIDERWAEVAAKRLDHYQTGLPGFWAGDGAPPAK